MLRVFIHELILCELESRLMRWNLAEFFGHFLKKEERKTSWVLRQLLKKGGEENWISLTWYNQIKRNLNITKREVKKNPTSTAPKAKNKESRTHDNLRTCGTVTTRSWIDGPRLTGFSSWLQHYSTQKQGVNLLEAQQQITVIPSKPWVSISKYATVDALQSAKEAWKLPSLVASMMRQPPQKISKSDPGGAFASPSNTQLT